MNLFNPLILYCILVIVAIILLVYAVAAFLGKFKDSHDVFPGLMLHWIEKNQWSIWRWVWGWAGLSLVCGFVLPWIMLGNDCRSLFGSSVSYWLTVLNYTLVVPLLLWGDLALLREAKLFLQPKNLSDLGLRFNENLRNSRLVKPVVRNLMSNSVLLVITCFVTAFGINEFINLPNLQEKFSDSSWLKIPTCSALSPMWAAFFYYPIIRGLNTYLALGLVFFIFALLYVFRFGLDCSGFEHFLVDDRVDPDNFELKDSIHELIKKLLICLFLGPLVVTIDGFALFFEYRKMDLLSFLMIVRAWLAWAVVVFVGAIILIYGRWKFNLSLKQAVRKKMRKNVTRLWEDQRKSLHSYNAKLEAFKKIDTYIHSGGKVPYERKSLFVISVALLEILIIILGRAFNP